jgi:hypothetical protein
MSINENKKEAMRLRKEVQEYLYKPLERALIDNLKDNNNKKTLSIGL